MKNKFRIVIPIPSYRRPIAKKEVITLTSIILRDAFETQSILQKEDGEALRIHSIPSLMKATPSKLS
jgi:hypothetical protein